MLVIESLGKTLKDERIEYKYFYRLVKSDFENRDFYGIEVERQDFSEETLISIEREIINYVGTELNKVLELLNLLAENLVSPIHLIDIAGSYVDRAIEEYGLNNLLSCS